MADVAQDRVLLAMLSEADYRDASFLDQRVMTPGRPSEWVDWADLATLSAGMADEAQFIFHIGHVGSTLLSRLLGELPTVFSVREPLMLRTLAEIHGLLDRPECPWKREAFDVRLASALGWLSRTFRAEQRALIKATSFASDLAVPVRRAGRRSIHMSVGPDAYMQTILGGDASRQELAALGGSRLIRLHRRLGEEPWQLRELSLGERAAMAWACEMTSLELADGEDVLWIDFDAFLAAPGSEFAKAAQHLGHDVEESAAATIVAGPIMKRYSKAPEHGYSTALRADVLAQARVAHLDELRRGRAWLEIAARRFPAIFQSMTRHAA
ncbi:MAG: hypothetical protein H0X36_03995 [Sphingomonadaceae bacterium]|nr:hypothetical protein [Sphingomonadaceae bacterium]